MKTLAQELEALLGRYEKWPIDSELEGFVPIAEVREILELHPDSGEASA